MKIQIFSRLLLVFVFIYCFKGNFLYGQGFTNGEIFDYDAGDEFLIMKSGTGPPQYRFEKVLSRLNYGNDSVKYLFESIYCNYNFSTFIWDTIQQKHYITYRNLSQSYFKDFTLNDSVAYYKMDTVPKHKIIVYYFHDTTLSDSCNIWNEREYYFGEPVSEKTHKVTKAMKRIGVLVESHIDYLESYFEELLYYKNDSGSCGNTKGLPFLSFKQIEKELVKIWPNPSNEKIEVEIEGFYNYYIMDALGRIILFENEKSSKEISLLNLNTGIYSIVIYNKEKRFQSKLIKT